MSGVCVRVVVCPLPVPEGACAAAPLGAPLAPLPWTVTVDQDDYEFCVVLENLGASPVVLQKGAPIGVLSFDLKDGLPETNISVQIGEPKGPVQFSSSSEAVNLLMFEVPRPERES